MLHLALLNQCPHRACDVLDGDVGVHPVLIQQIDGGHFQSLQHRLDNLTNALGPAVDAVSRAVGIDAEPELRRNHDMLAMRRQRLADELLVREWTISFSRVEHRHAAFDRRVDQSDGVVAGGGGAVGPRQSHAAVPDRRDLQPAGA